MRPLDPRLLRRAASARRWVLTSAVLQACSAGLLVAQAVWLAGAVAGVVGGAPAATVVAPATGLVVVFVLRAGLAGLAERFAHRAGVRVIAELRDAVLDHVQAAARVTGPQHRTTADLAVLLTSGLDQLDGYLVRYLPQLLATALITPTLLIVVATRDLVSAAIIAGTLPLVPFFMALVGWTTQRISAERITRMRRLGDQVLDLVTGLPTLRALGRAFAQTARVRAVGEAYRAATMKVLRVAFLSGLVLELLTTICVALVAVGIGMRLVYGTLDLATGLTVLILAPEVYLPLRMVGLHFHASTDGIAAAAAALAVLDEPVRANPAGAPGRTSVPPVRAVCWDEVSVVHPGRTAPNGLTGRATAGQVSALVGPTGDGKSSAVAALLGLTDCSAGRVVLHPVRGEPIDLADADLTSWHRQVAWVGQQPVLIPGTLADNVRLVAPQATDAELAAAARPSGLQEVLAALPDGWQTRVGDGGVGLSAGQRQRLALARLAVQVARGARVAILDEPSAHLDPHTEAVVVRLLTRLADDGLIVIVVAHRQSLVSAADVVIPVGERVRG